VRDVNKSCIPSQNVCAVASDSTHLERALMEFVENLSEDEKLIPVFKNQVGGYFLSGMMSHWGAIASSPVRVTPTSVQLDEEFFSWSRIPESLRQAVADYYSEYAPRYPMSAAAPDLQYFFWGNEFKLHMFEDVTGLKENPSVNGMTLAGWNPLRNWLIEGRPDEAASLGSLLHQRSHKGKHELTDPLTYLKSLLATNDTYLLAGSALWRLQRQVEKFELDEAVEEYSFAFEFGW